MLRSKIIKNLICLLFILKWFNARHFEYYCKRCSLNHWKQSAQERLLTSNKRNIIRWKIYRDNKRPFYSYVWNRGWTWPCFETNLPALSCKSSYSYANQYFSLTISITKQRRFVSKQGHREPHIHSKARVLSPQLKNGLFSFRKTSIKLSLKILSLPSLKLKFMFWNQFKPLPGVCFLQRRTRDKKIAQSFLFQPEL